MAQRQENYETQKGIAYLDPEIALAKLTPNQRKRIKHKGDNVRGDRPH